MKMKKTIKNIISTKDMTLRDYFAGQALLGMLERIDTKHPRGCVDGYAIDCYALADAMLAERNK